MYGLSGYGYMLTDKVRVNAYADAMLEALRPDSVVLDIGSGPGYFALLAARHGARHVYAIEPSNIIQVGRQAARDHGLADRISFIQGLSTETELPEQADIVISDLRGVVPLFHSHLPSIIDARQRLLTDGGILLPGRDDIYVAPVQAEKAYTEGSEPWMNNAHDLKLSEGWHLWANSPFKIYLGEENLLAEPQLWQSLDYYRQTETKHFGSSLNFTLQRAGTVHGLLMWFETELSAGHGFTNRPGTERKLYGQLFFPLEQPLQLSAGSPLECLMRANFVGTENFWAWRAVSGDQASAAQPQSNFQGMPLTQHALDASLN